MPRAIWKGGISFGLVYIPVKLYSGSVSHDIDFNMVRKGDQCAIKYIRVCEKDGKEVPWDNIVKGTKLDDFFVTLSDDDFKRARSGKSESIDIEDFVKAEEINPRYFEKPYLLEPEKGAGKTYNLLRTAIYESKMAGISRFVLRNREHLALLMADEHVMYLAQMRFHDELRNPEELKIPASKPKKEEIDMALKLIKQMSKPFDPASYKDAYEQNLKKIIKAKSQKKEIKKLELTPEVTAVDDLLEQLKKSLEVV